MAEKIDIDIGNARRRLFDDAQRLGRLILSLRRRRTHLGFPPRISRHHLIAALAPTRSRPQELIRMPLFERHGNVPDGNLNAPALGEFDEQCIITKSIDERFVVDDRIDESFEWILRAQFPR